MSGTGAQVITGAAGVMINAIGPVATSALIAATPLTSSSGTLLQKVSNFFEFLVYMNGRRIHLADIILKAVGISIIPPIFNNMMDISEETVNCTPPSRFLDNELSCNILNNYGKELQFIALVACICSLIILAYKLTQKYCKPSSKLRSALQRLATMFGWQYLMIIFEGSNLEIYGLSSLHLSTAGQSSSQLLFSVVAVLLLVMNVAMAVMIVLFTVSLMSKIQDVATESKLLHDEIKHMDKQTRKDKDKTIKQRQAQVTECFKQACKASRFSIFSFIVEGFLPHGRQIQFWIPFISMMRNLVSQLIVVSLADRGMAQVWLVMVVQVAFAAVRTAYRPRSDRLEDWVEVASSILFGVYMLLVLMAEGVQSEEKV